MDKAAIKSFAIEARRNLAASVKDKAGLLGITSKGCSKPEQKGEGLEVYRTNAGTENKIFEKEMKQRQSLVNRIEEKGYEHVMEEAAYTWFNHIIAIRLMEVNDYLPSRVRVLSSGNNNKTEPDIVSKAPDVDLDFTESEKKCIYSLKAENKLDELFRMLFIRQCNKLGEILPELFVKVSDYDELLLNISYTNKDGIIRILVDTIKEDDFKEAAEIIGWMYQYYNYERKNEVINIHKGNVKKEDIPAATQIFTTDWVVRYMVDNSLGRYWMERHPDSKLKEKLQFIIDYKASDKNPIEVQSHGDNPSVKNIKLLDPCMGSGHILTYAFDVFMEIYRECGYTDRDAAKSIIVNNLYGLDIDGRVYQLAYFELMMKARSYNRRILSDKEAAPNLCAIQESNGMDKFRCEGIKIDAKYAETADYLIETFRDAKEIGSIQVVEKRDYEGLKNYLQKLQEEGSSDLSTCRWVTKTAGLLNSLIKQAEILSKRYEAVVTNPPYLNRMEGSLKKFVSENYKDYSGDLFSVFIYRNFEFCKPHGYSAFMTPFVWMFIKTYEKLREYIIKQKSISSLIQMEYSAFEEATVPICTFVLQNANDNRYGYYIRLSDFKGGMEVQKQKLLEAIESKGCSYCCSTDIDEFVKIPGMPIAYWASGNIFKDFEDGRSISESCEIRQGLITANNIKFLRLWFEVALEDIGFNKRDAYEFSRDKKRWLPYNKGGDFRKWYGNNEYVVNWYDDGYDIKNYRDETGKLLSRPQNINYFFREGITWSMISSGSISLRFVPYGFGFDARGSMIFTGDDSIYYILGLMCSKPINKFMEFLSPTISFEVGNVSKIPMIFSDDYKDDVEDKVRNIIAISQNDWDSFETSWGFKRHPFITYRPKGCSSVSMESCYNAWDAEMQKNFNKLKLYEEELNRIFIEIYGLQDELSPEVEDKDVTIRRADLGRDVRSFISYAVGCLFGRYSLDEDGIIFAGGSWEDPLNSGRYRTIIPDRDNVILITDEEYFEDDLTGLFVKFVRAAFGEDTLEENLSFIANALGNKGVSSRDVIRKYFVKDFYKDHLKIYKMRPIYWMFDSGKENGFKALIYMHRYDADTAARVMADYLHKVQNAIENAIKSAEYIMKASSSNAERAKAAKDREKYMRQLSETRIYDEAMAHIARRRIIIDLNDGVRVNYAKFQNIELSSQGKKARGIDLLDKL